MIEKWKSLFDEKCRVEELGNDSINIFIKQSIDSLNFTDEETKLLNKYLDYELNKKEYDLIRDEVITNRLKIDRRNLERDEVKTRVKKTLINYFLLYVFPARRHEEEDDFFDSSNQDYDDYDEHIVLDIMELLVNSTVHEEKFIAEMEYQTGDIYVMSGRLKSNINSEGIINSGVNIDYSRIYFIEYSGFGIFSENNSYKLDVKDERVYMNSKPYYVEATIEEKDNLNISWESIVEGAYMEASVYCFVSSFSWEDYLIESFQQYKQKNYKLAFLQSIISLESFIESSIFQMKQILTKEISDWVSNNNVSEEVEILINSLVSDEQSSQSDMNKEITDLIYFIKRISNNKRNLINDKFVDLININNYFHLKEKKELFNEGNKFLIYCRNRLNYMIKIRNTLAHGDKIDKDIDFLLLYKEMLSVFIYIILEFKNNQLSIKTLLNDCMYEAEKDN